MTRRLEGPAARFAAASACGGLVALVVLGWFAARHGLFGVVPNGNFYEVQARSWLDGRWDADPEAYGFERFDVDGRYMTYFGPWPALLRLPVVALTDSLDGKLSGLAVLLACVVLLTGVGGVSWEARRVFRGEAAPTARELVAAAALVLLAGCGTLVVFLAGWTAVYHEAILWGAGWALVSSWFLLRYLRRDRLADVAIAGCAAALAVLSRGSVGMGPVVAVGIVAAGRALAAPRRRGELRAVVAPAAAALVPFVLFCAVNFVKFGEPIGAPPVELQDRLLDFPTRRAALDANGGTLFGLRYAPTGLLHYLRPDGVRFDRLFPWVTFPPPARVVGGSVFESLNPSASIPATSTLPFLLAAAGVVTALRVRAARRFVPLVAGAAVGASGAVALAFVDQRYEGDFLPLLLVPATLGWWALGGWRTTRGRSARRATTAAVVALAAWSCWANGALSFVYTQAYQPFADAGSRADLIAAQLRVHDWFGDGPPSRVRVFEQVPLRSSDPPGTFGVVGDCGGLLWSDGRQWLPVEQTPATGQYSVRVELDAGPAGRREPILTVDSGERTFVLWAVRGDDGAARLDLSWFDSEGAEAVLTGTGGIDPGGAVDVELRLHPGGALITEASATVDGREVLRGGAPGGGGAADLGRQPFPDAGATTLTGRVEAGAPPPTPLCDRLRGADG